MVITADLKCYNCSRVCAEALAEARGSGGRLKVERFRRMTFFLCSLGPDAHPRCGRCGGRVYLEDVEPAREARLGWN